MRLPALVGLSLCSIALASGREPQTAPSASDLVQVDVLVTDRADRPVRDLTIDDFEIVDGGRPQKIANFRFVHVLPGKRDPAAAALDVSTSPGGRRFAIVIDDLHVPLDTLMLRRVKEMLGEFLRGLTPADQVAVVYTQRSEMSQGFTNDLAAQLRAVDRFRAALDARYPSPGNWPRDYEASLSKLRDAVRTLADSPQARRAVLFVAEGLPSVKDNPGAAPSNEMAGLAEIGDLFEATRRANVPVYTIDPRSLLPISGEPIDRQIERGQQETLRELATNTGGRAFVDRPKMRGAVEEILADSGSFYVLGFTPDPAVRDGKFHPIEVRVKRPDVRVRTRGGYVAAGHRTSTHGT